MADRRRPAPARLSAEGKALWRAVLAEYELEAHHAALFGAALEALDRMRQAQRAIERDGAFVVGRFGPKQHPGLAVERDSRLAFARLIRELGLDLE